MPDHLQEALDLFPVEVSKARSGSYTSREFIRSVGMTYPEMSKEEEWNPSEEFFMENFIHKFQHDSRAIYNFLYEHDEGWSLQPDRTKVLLLESGMVDRDRLVKSPPRSSAFNEMGFPVKLFPASLHDVLVSAWIDTDKEFSIEQDPEHKLVTASRWADEENVQDVIVDFYDADAVFAEWMMFSKVDFKELGERITDDLLDMEEENVGMAEASLDSIIQYGKNMIHYKGLLGSRSDKIRGVVSRSILHGFAKKYKLSENTWQTRKEMEETMLELIEHEDIRKRIDDNGLFNLKMGNKDLYCDFMKHLSLKLEVLQNPFRYTIRRLHRDGCK